MNPFQAPSRSASGSGMFSGILATRSVDSSQDDDDNNNNASVGRNETHRQSPSRTSSLQESNQSGMINGRGALIGGIAIPKSDDSEEEDDDDNYDATSSMDEIEYTGGGGEDLEHGTDAPDSDYASYAPPSIFQNSKKYQVANKSKRVLGSRSNENKASATAVLSNFPVTIKNHQPPMEGPLESDVSTEELHRSSTDGKQHRPTVWYGLVIISCLLIGAVTAVGILVTRRMDDDATSNMTSRQKELNDIVASLVEPLLLQNPDSAQAKANAWLIYDDTQWMDETVNVTSAMVVQRYVLAVFYFATSGSFWSNSNWLVGHECNSNNNSNNDTWIGVKCSSDGQVRALVFEEQGLVGTIPAEVGHLSQLMNFVIKKESGLVGSIPSSFGKFSTLRQLGLSNTKLSGSIPSELFLVSSLAYLNLESNEMTGSLSTLVGNFRAIKTFVLSKNYLTGSIPFENLATTPLEYLGLSTNKFSGEISSAIQDMAALRYLYLDHNELVGKIPVALSGAANLRSINLDYNELSGGVPAVIGRLKNLEYLSLQGCQLTGSIPGEINFLTKMKALNLASNNFTGVLPDISPLTSLVSLMLANNRFHGRVQSSFGDLQSLETLFLSSNDFTGPLPSLMDLGELRGLYLSNNNFNGTIPATICNLTNLDALFVDTNELTGNVPPCIGNLVDLQQFFAFQNKLSGELPTELSSLRKLTGIGIEHNAFVGEVSNDLCELTSNEAFTSFWSDCGGNSPEIVCPCCNVCCPSAQCV